MCICIGLRIILFLLTGSWTPRLTYRSITNRNCRLRCYRITKPFYRVSIIWAYCGCRRIQWIYLTAHFIWTLWIWSITSGFWHNGPNVSAIGNESVHVSNQWNLHSWRLEYWRCLHLHHDDYQIVYSIREWYDFPLCYNQRPRWSSEICGGWLLLLKCKLRSVQSHLPY